MSKSLKKLIDISRLREFKNKLVGTGSAYVQTGAVDQTVAGTKTFSEPIVGSVTGSSGSCTGNADTATNATNSNAANQLQAFVNDNFTDGNHYVKAIRASQGWSTHLWMCYNNGAKMADEVSVNYANSAGSANTANSATTATTAEACTGNAATANIANSAVTANYAKSVRTPNGNTITFDWGSQVPDYVGLRVDVTDMGGIVTTNRLVSDIRAQWYAAYPDGAEAHNAMWGGRDITAAFNNGTVSANIANGTFRDIFPGDYITKQVTVWDTTYTVNWVIADCDYWINKGDTATTDHHVVIVPQVPIFSYPMNGTNTTEGGYAGSAMYRDIIPACATGIVNAFGADHILTFRDGISNSVDTSHVSSGIPQWTGTPGWWGTWVSVECNLMSEKMVYGAPVCSAGAMDNTMATRQMSAFRLSERLINYNHQGWWLRDIAASALFAFVAGDGTAGTGAASDVLGVRPFALLI